MCVYVCVLVCSCHSSCAIALNKFDKGKKEEGDEEEKKKKIGKASRWAMNLGGKFFIVSVIVKYYDAHTLTPSLILSEKYNILES